MSSDTTYQHASTDLYLADSLELLKIFKSESIQLIFADPPYFLSTGGMTCIGGKVVSVDKGDWDRELKSLEEKTAFAQTWLGECKRLLKDSGSIFVSGTMHSIFFTGFVMQQLGYHILNDIVWQKPNPPPNLACRCFTHATETIIWAKKDRKAKHYFNYGLMKELNGGKQMQNVWKMKSPGNSEKVFGKHPAQKPVELLLRIVQACSTAGDMVLDPFMGAGTTGVACKHLGRSFIGIEKEKEFFDIAKARIERGSDIFIDK